jgi:hypothetical protein
MDGTNPMTLQTEIDTQRAEIRTDELQMSIGEWISLYENHELDIHPEFQRFYRWTPVQKTRLIESILLGIPIPPIFVAQREDGVWDVVDGLQRLSTIFEFAGILQGEDATLLDPLRLEATKYLPSLEGVFWDNEEDPDHSMDQKQRLYIKRTRIGASVILRESGEQTKYELFQRLNTGGSPLSDQEVRNCILVMSNRDMYFWMRSLADDEHFRACVALTDRAYDEQYDLELILRFLVFRMIPVQAMHNIRDIGDFLTDQMLELAQSGDFDKQKEEKMFRQTFRMLANSTSQDSFRRYDSARTRFVGGFLISAFEAVALGLGYNVEAWIDGIGDIRERVMRVWSERDFASWSGAGVRASSRIPRVIPLGRSLFKP